MDQLSILYGIYDAGFWYAVTWVAVMSTGTAAVVCLIMWGLAVRRAKREGAMAIERLRRAVED